MTDHHEDLLDDNRYNIVMHPLDIKRLGLEDKAYGSYVKQKEVGSGSVTSSHQPSDKE